MLFCTLHGTKDIEIHYSNAAPFATWATNTAGTVVRHAPATSTKDARQIAHGWAHRMLVTRAAKYGSIVRKASTLIFNAGGGFYVANNAAYYLEHWLPVTVAYMRGAAALERHILGSGFVGKSVLYFGGFGLVHGNGQPVYRPEEMEYAVAYAVAAVTGAESEHPRAIDFSAGAC